MLLLAREENATSLLWIMDVIDIEQMSAQRIPPIQEAFSGYLQYVPAMGIHLFRGTAQRPALII